MPELKQPVKSVIQSGRRRLYYSYTDGTELVEEYDVVTDELLLRKSRRQDPDSIRAIATCDAQGGMRANELSHAGEVFGDDGAGWVLEVGNETCSFNPDKDHIRESSGQPVLSRSDDKESIIFRIRNLPYSPDVFSVTVEGQGLGEIVVRTSNKKYYKRIEVPDLRRANVALEASRLSFSHSNNTLIIKYRKPLSLLSQESIAKKERAAMPSVRLKDEANRGCPQQ